MCSFDAYGAPVKNDGDPRLWDHYSSMRPHEKNEFMFVIKSIGHIVGRAEASVVGTYTDQPIDIDADGFAISWGRLHNQQGQGLKRVQDWICRLYFPTLAFPGNHKYWPLTKRIAFPLRLYGRRARRPIVTNWKGQDEHIGSGFAFLPELGDDYPRDDPRQFSEHLRRWLDSARLGQAVQTVQPPGGASV